MDATSHLVDSGPMTIEQFERLPDEPERLELVRGHVVREPPAGFEHCGIAGQITVCLGTFVRQHALGKVVTGDPGFVLFDDPPTVRAPDVAFVARDRLPDDPRGFARLAPDLAVEVVSPSNTLSGIQDKVFDFLDAGTRLVWVVEPRGRTVTVYRSRDDIRILTASQEIEGGDVLPGLRIEVSEFFAD
ncbi:MAG: Uma2 family endonuclease [Gemmatimonadota bacterium]